MIGRNNSLKKSYLVCSDINERYDIGYASLTSVFELFANQFSGGSLVSAIAYFLSSRVRNSVNFQPICTILVSKIIS